MKKSHTLVLDLDQTIISGEKLEEYEEGDWIQKESKFAHATMPGYFIIFERPHLQEFLDFIFENFNVIVWTAASKDYALFIIEHIILKGNPRRKLEWIFFYYHCTHSEEQQHGLKNLKLLWENFKLPGINPETTFIVDDNEEVYALQPSRTIHIPPFEFTQEGSEEDVVLLSVINHLKGILKQSSVNTKKVTRDLRKRARLE